MAGNLYSYTDGTFANAKENNDCDRLNTEHNNIETALNVLETGYLPLGVGRSVTGNRYTATTDGIYDTAGQNGAHCYTGFGTTALKRFGQNWVKEIPADAKSGTTATFKFIWWVDGSSSAGEKVKWNFGNQVYTKDSTVLSVTAFTTDSSVITLTAGGAEDVGEYHVDTFTTDAVSAGQIIVMQLWRYPDDADDTAGGTVRLADAMLTYTRTA